MIPTNFDLANSLMRGGPASKYGTSSDVMDLPAWKPPASAVVAGVEAPATISCWRPTWRERLSILIFGRVWLNLATMKMPPAALWGHRRGWVRSLGEPWRRRAREILLRPTEAWKRWGRR